MMPGEAPAAGIAAEAATACANCSALQQNLNEYVAALIALKQKIIDTDRLLTEYQQKCNELQLAERENNTLRHQVEQMLQKISPLEECQQELGSLKAELEEKKSSLKIYQQTHLEYARVKEEIVRSDAVKKKLEAKVKKLEEAATKHMQDFRQLKTEKKVLEKELKKAQEKLDDFPKQKYKKVLKHAETQSAREDPVANIDKGKIKLLLEELWMCIDSSTGKRQNQENDYILAASVKDRTRTSEKTGKLFTEEVEQSHRKFRKSNGKMPYPHSSPETIGKQNSLTTLQIKVDKEPHRGDHFESKTTEEYLQDYNGDNAFYEDKTIKVVVQTDLTDSSSDSSDQEQEQLGGNLLDILNWVRPLPPLLSPVRFSPPAMQHLAKPLLRAILSKLKTQKMSLNHNFTQALCRVYVGICRQLGDLERARLFCYSLLKEDFPQSAKLTLFITNVWDDIFSFQGVINKAMQLIARQRARGEVLHCLSAYLSWEKSPPLDAGIMVSSLLLAIQLYPKMEFQLSERYGEDLSESTWECILAIDLLCSHLKWGWTHDNIISKELWPVMDKWVKHRKGHETIPSTPDIIVASTLRLIGRLCQIGLKEGFFSAVKNISFVIGRFIQHAKEEDVPWGVQLAAVYALCDLGPSNPVGVIEAIRAWRTAITNSIPAAVTSGIAEVSSLCTAELHSDEGK
ncbi:little elongation complex subunit 1 isoform X8 [Emydura macquarii macquarii]|uniref:little elongation complex subunit 1 isoform X8 n=1 Tax=Emydura macquarii macquarii TaxID=1129001 RepID=UPI00352BA635